MTDLVLIDTSSWVPALRRDGDAAVRERVRRLLADGRAALTELVLVELWHGVRRDAEGNRLRELQLALPLVEARPSAWARAFDLARRTHAKGFTIPVTELVVAAVALDQGLRVEHNDQHYEHIQNSLTGRERILL